jgi:hypothetical protein
MKKAKKTHVQQQRRNTTKYIEKWPNGGNEKKSNKKGTENIKKQNPIGKEKECRNVE